MTKFKVGDKVRVLDVSKIIGGSSNYYDGMETEVVSMFEGIDGIFYPQLKSKCGGKGVIIHSKEYDAIELIENNPNQRITALEEKVKYLESVVDSLTHKKWTEDDINELEAQVLTNNQKRKAIIEKAKKFVEEHSEGFAFDFDDNATCAARLVKLEDEVGYEAQIGYSKCHPHEVFNEHIGKAIALGRALGLDVSEFEQAAQPDEFAECQVVIYQSPWSGKNVRTITKIEDGEAHTKEGGFFYKERVKADFIKITNDTDAVY